MSLSDLASSERVAAVLHGAFWRILHAKVKPAASDICKVQIWVVHRESNSSPSVQKKKTKKGRAGLLLCEKLKPRTLFCCVNFKLGQNYQMEQRVSSLCTPCRKTPTPNSIVVSKCVTISVHWPLLLVGRGVHTHEDPTELLRAAKTWCMDWSLTNSHSSSIHPGSFFPSFFCFHLHFTWCACRIFAHGGTVVQISWFVVCLITWTCVCGDRGWAVVLIIIHLILVIIFFTVLKLSNSFQASPEKY